MYVYQVLLGCERRGQKLCEGCGETKTVCTIEGSMSFCIKMVQNTLVIKHKFVEIAMKCWVNQLSYK